MKVLTKTASALLLLSLFFAACKKDKNEPKPGFDKLIVGSWHLDSTNIYFSPGEKVIQEKKVNDTYKFDEEGELYMAKISLTVPYSVTGSQLIIDSKKYTIVKLDAHNLKYELSENNVKYGGVYGIRTTVNVFSR